jgi:predicted TIM-barrel fold metal-dependent hydrolase
MVTRRNVLKALAVGCATASAVPVIAATKRSSPAVLRSRVPAHACDCHSHIIGPYNRYPMVESRIYTPPMASVDELKAMHAKLGIERSVLVQPSFYGIDNSFLLDALKEIGSTARGVAVISANPTSVEIDRLRAAGIMGIRINQTGGSKDPQALRGVLEAAGRQAAEQGWCVQAFFPLKTIASLADVIEASPAPFLLDHFAGANATGVQQEGMDRVLGLVKSGKANPHRVLWATDWPHTNSEKVPGRKKDDISPFYPIDNMNLLAKFFEWVPDAATRKAILVENPAHLFRFA